MSAPALGALRRRFTVEAPVAGADGALGYESRFRAWGALEAARDGATVHLRARNDIEPGWRLRTGPRVFEVLSRQRDENASGFMICACREVSP